MWWADIDEEINFQSDFAHVTPSERVILTLWRAHRTPASSHRAREMSSHACAQPARATIAVAPRLGRRASAPRIARAHRSTRPRATSTSAGSTSSSSEADASRAPYVGPPRVVILGGGFGGLYTALKLDALTWPDASKRPVVTLVDRAERFVFKPMLYELVNETMSDWEVAPTFDDLLEPTSVRYVRGDVAAVRTGDEVPFADGTTGSSGGGTVELASGESVEYDWLVVAVGTASAADAKCPGAKDFAIPLSTLEDARRLAGAMRDVEAAFETDRAAAATGGGSGASESRKVAVVGGGLSGVELAGVVAERLAGKASVELFASGAGIMPESPPGQRDAARRQLDAAGVTTRAGTRAVRISEPSSGSSSGVPSGVSSPPDARIASAASLTYAEGDFESRTEDYDVVCWAVGQRVEAPESWPFPRDRRTNKIITERTLRVRGHGRVFAVGDVARVWDSPSAGFPGGDAPTTTPNAASPPPDRFDVLPATAQVAFQQADYAAWNVWSSLSSRPLLPFKYQHIGDMMVLGKTDAAVALPVGDATLDGPIAAALRRAAYLYRMPTNEHRAKLATSWLEQGAELAAKEAPGILKSLGVPLPDFLAPNNNRP